MLQTNSFQCSHNWSPYGVNADFHLHDQFELYFFISGDVDYFVERVKYRLSFGDVLLMNGAELHKPTFFGQAPYERMVLHFDPAFAAQFSTPEFDLLACFTARKPGTDNLLRMHTAHTRALHDLLRQLSDLPARPAEGRDALRLALFLEILVLVGRAFQNRDAQTPNDDKHPLRALIDYIDQNLTADLGLDALAERFFISKPYLCRSFKVYTGATIHSYILGKRIALAKQLLLSGESVTAACQNAGFNDYANFIRAFKKMTGLSPGAFKKDAR